MTMAIFFFTLMEILQCVQYFFIAGSLGDRRCEMRMNRILTVVGYVHIHFQPYFTNFFYQSFRHVKKWTKNEDAKWDLVGKLCLAQAALGLLRLWSHGNHDAYYASTNDWLEGPKLCTYRGSHHLAWSLPLAPSSYFLPNMGLHMFLMFVPVLVIGGLEELDAALFLFLTGPVFASYVSANKHESASIWCFFSTMQCAIGAISAILQTTSSHNQARLHHHNNNSPLQETKKIKTSFYKGLEVETNNLKQGRLALSPTTTSHLIKDLQRSSPSPTSNTYRLRK